jgi:hypothetical protein
VVFITDSANADIATDACSVGIIEAIVTGAAIGIGIGAVIEEAIGNCNTSKATLTSDINNITENMIEINII